jgi:hypothetical protein
MHASHNITLHEKHKTAHKATQTMKDISENEENAMKEDMKRPLLQVLEMHRVVRCWGSQIVCTIDS